MKRMILLVSVCILSLLVPVAVLADGNLFVTSGPAGASIFIGGSDSGHVTPYNFTQPAGSYSIIVRLTGYVDESSSVTVVDGQTVLKAVSMTPVPVSAPAISGISPSGAANSTWQSVEITGTGFNGAAVTLAKTGETTVSGAVLGSDSASLLTRNFNLHGLTPGSWNLVVLNADGGNVTGSFVISPASAASLASVSPTSGTVNTTVSITFTGTGFVSGSAKTRLYQGTNYITGIVASGATSTSVAATFDLSKGLAGAYDACILSDGTDASKICTAFTISPIAAVNGSFYFTSNPSSAGVFLNSVYKGRTPFTLDNVTPGTYTILFRSTGYQDLSKSFSVTAGSTTNAYGYLEVVPADTISTPVYTVPTTVRKTETITKKSTAKIPTPWPTATPAKSPVELMVILGAVGLGIVIIRK